MKTKTSDQPDIVPDYILEQKGSPDSYIIRRLEFKNHHKIITITILFSLFLTYRFIHFQPINKNCLIDNMHEWTFPINRWIAFNFARPFIGLGQVIMDISITFMLIYWMLYVKNFRVLLVAAFFQYGRQFMLKIVTMPFESYTVWYNPGFPTWTVEYGHTSDYFFSGHTGTIVVLYLEAKRLNLPNAVQYLLVLSIGYIIFMLLVARVHYTADVFTGFFFAGFCYEMTDRHLEFLDMIINSPYRVFEILKEKVKRKLAENGDEGTSMFEIQHQ